MTRRIQTLLAGLVLLVALVALTFTMTVPFVALVPGPTVNTIGKYTDGKQVIQVEGKSQNNGRQGHLNLTTVGVIDQITPYNAIVGWFSDAVSVVPAETVFPPNQTRQQVDKQNKADFNDSENSAISAALGNLGYPDKVVVVDPPKGSVLVAGDAINTFNGAAISTYQDLKANLAATAPGAKVTIDYEHLGAPSITTLTTKATTDGSAGSLLGVSVNQRPYAPFNVTFAQNDIGGPSAGLMLTLGVIDIVGPKSITGGKFIAGTGTIDATGKVGPIGGIRLKMKMASQVGAQIFLTPAENCAEALTNPPTGLQIVKVTDLKSALAAVNQFTSGQKSLPSCQAS
ncbi:MAG: S16 family serine protease [Antricoccus sp.]